MLLIENGEKKQNEGSNSLTARTSYLGKVTPIACDG